MNGVSSLSTCFPFLLNALPCLLYTAWQQMNGLSSLPTCFPFLSYRGDSSNCYISQSLTTKGKCWDNFVSTWHERGGGGLHVKADQRGLGGLDGHKRAWGGHMELWIAWRGGRQKSSRGRCANQSSWWGGIYLQIESQLQQNLPSGRVPLCYVFRISCFCWFWESNNLVQKPIGAFLIR